MTGEWRSKRRKLDRERGASLVEMALLAPFLVLLVLGVVESSWLLARSLDIAGAAREAGRLASIDHGDENAIKAAVCAGMDQPAGARISLSGESSGLGGDVVATASQSVGTLTGFLDPFFSPPVPLTRSTTFVLEQPTVTWHDVVDSPC
ncbi:MAG TPA: TadE/TadG family type IV pilus assembly protein [Acidimicrobiia bacterium]|nr:TadE/TadG family type IV pilus assembly protein [Acidimicrobiia bacterium]